MKRENNNEKMKTPSSSNDNKKPKTVHDIFRDSKGEQLNLGKLSINEVFRKIAQIEELQGCDAKNENIVAVMGNTKCGKSSALNLILGNQLKSIKKGNIFDQNFALILYEEIVKSPEIGSDVLSKTTVPDKYTSKDNIFWDCPGFGDNRSVQQEIINAYLVNRLLTTAKAVKVLNLIDFESLSVDNTTGFQQYVKHLKDLFGNNIKNMHQCLIVTKLPLLMKLDGNLLKQGVGELLNKLFPNDSSLEDFFINNAEYCSITRPDKENDIWNHEKVQNVIELLSKASYEDYKNVGISISSDAKLYLHTNGHEVSQALVQTYLKCFIGSHLLRQFYQDVFNVVGNDKDVSELQYAFSENIKSSYSKYLQSALKDYEKFEDQTIGFITKVCKELDIMSTVNQMKKMVEQYCLYEISHCATKDFLSYLINHSSNKEAYKSTLKEFNEIGHIEFQEIAKGINSIIEAQQKFNTAQRKAAHTHNQSYGEKAQKEYQEYCNEVFRNNQKAYESYAMQCKKVGWVDLTLDGLNTAIDWIADSVTILAPQGVALVTNVFHDMASQTIKNLKFKEINKFPEEPSVKKLEKSINDFKEVLDKSFKEYYEQNEEILLNDAFESLELEINVLGENNI